MAGRIRRRVGRFRRDRTAVRAWRVAGLIEVQRSFRDRAGSGRDVIITHRPLDEAVAKTYILLAKDVRPTILAKSRWEALTALGGRA